MPTDEQSYSLSNLSLDQAWEIAGDFGAFLEKHAKDGLRQFESVLPHKKGLIRYALLKILIEEESKEARSVAAANLVALETAFIPDQQRYQELLQEKEILNQSLE